MIVFDRLAPQTEMFSALDPQWQWQIHHCPLMLSTNQALLDFFKHAPFTQAPSPDMSWLVLSDQQTAGRGRLGRVWQSDAANIYLSLGIYLTQDLSCLSSLPLMVAWAVQQSVSRQLQVPVVQLPIKWPNDLMALIDGVAHKWGGILIEVTKNSTITEGWFVVVGMGVNIDCPVLQESSDFSMPVCGLSDMSSLSCTRDILLTPLVNDVMQWMTTFMQQGFSLYQQEWQNNMLWIDRMVSLIDRQGEVMVQGILKGVDVDGALRIEVAGQDKEQVFVAGDLHVRAVT